MKKDSILKEAIEEYQKVWNKKPNEFWIIVTLLCMVIKELRRKNENL